MRPYRGLTKDGKWAYGWYCKVKGKHYIILDDAELAMIESSINFGIAGFVEVIPETVGQATGLYWEDDILESRDKLRRYIVTYNKKECQWYLKGIGKAWCVTAPTWSDYKHIGNVHQPELLEEKE